MYGAQESTAGGMVLVAAGLTTGAWVLAIVGLALAGIALTALIRKPGPHRP
ncbi:MULTISPECIES: hypothetical protein [Kocuria]|uniref:hypothetical protein n=1 Tax=Kocuria TaxID=57493 RepID=UPI00116EE933|nr:hypothetical protein [Kocuria rosea]TQN33677.1 hypothetical protein FHX38_3158 [Kocuria rosea]